MIARASRKEVSEGTVSQSKMILSEAECREEEFLGTEDIMLLVVGVILVLLALLIAVKVLPASPLPGAYQRPRLAGSGITRWVARQQSEPGASRPWRVDIFPQEAVLRTAGARIHAHRVPGSWRI